MTNTPDASRSPAESLGPYSLVRLLGRGGMGEVWLAHDPRLGRDVALKVLPDQIAKRPELRQRFLREARAVAALNHPNIMTIHEVGEVDGRSYIAFEHIDGQTLAEILAERKLEPAELVEFALRIAQALDYAHERGIVHRDIKPGNVMVTTRGLVKVLDFGLAKVLQESPARVSGGGATSLTLPNAVFGTPSAMSPEQALGGLVDGRSDIFSFGSLLYQMASGQSPFARETAMATIDAVIHAEPPSLAGLQPALAPELIALVERAMRKKPDERFPAMHELLAELQRVELALRQPAAVVPGARRRARRGPRSAAVMYFENLTDPQDGDQIGAMLAHLLTTELATDGELTMISQQRLFETAKLLGRADGTIDRDVASEVARRAGVMTMLVGHVARTEGRTVATMLLVDVESGRTLGSCKANGASTPDVFAMAEALGAAARETLTSSGHTRKPTGRSNDRSRDAATLRERLTPSVEAYRSYVQGMGYLQRTQWLKASDAFGAAVDIDPTFAVAHYWQALACAWGNDSEKARRAIQRAAAFREKLSADLQRVLGAAESFIHDRLDEALPVLLGIVRDDPDNRDALYMLGEIYLHSATRADPRAAARVFRRAVDLNPDFHFFHRHLVDALKITGQISEARKVVESWTSAAVHSQAQALSGVETYAGRMDAALQALESTQPDNLTSIVAILLVADRPGDPRVAACMAAFAKHVPGWASQSPAGLAIKVAAMVRLPLARGAFTQAGEMLHLVAAARTATGNSGMAGSCVVHATVCRALLEDLRGDKGHARVLMDEALEAHPLAPRFRFLAAVLAGRRGDRSNIAAQVAVLEDAAGRGWGPMCAHYRDAACAELALAEGRPSEAIERCERVIASGDLCADDFVYTSSASPFIRDALARAREAAGDADGAAAAWRALIESGVEWAGYPMLRVLALHRLGVFELQCGRDEEGRAFLRRFLDYWGDADWKLPEVADARARLALGG